MFIYKSGRFHFGSTSFALPKECLVDTVTPIESHHGILIKPLNQSFQIYIDYYPGDKDAIGSITELIDGWSKATGFKREDFACGTGWSTFYGNEINSFYEVRFDMKTPTHDEKGRMLRTLTVEIKAETMDKVRTAVQSALFKELLESIEL